MSERQGYGLVTTRYELSISASNASSSIITDVDEYSYHTVQLVLTGSRPTGSLNVQSSLNRINWFPDISTVTHFGSTSSLHYLTTGRRKFLQHTLNLAGNVTGSVYQLSGQ